MTTRSMTTGISDLLMDSLGTREVTWHRYGDIQEWITGGQTWGDDPTEAFGTWGSTWDICDDLAPGLLAAVGIFFSPILVLA